MTKKFVLAMIFALLAMIGVNVIAYALSNDPFPGDTNANTPESEDEDEDSDKDLNGHGYTYAGFDTSKYD